MPRWFPLTSGLMLAAGCGLLVAWTVVRWFAWALGALLLIAEALALRAMRWRWRRRGVVPRGGGHLGRRWPTASLVALVLVLCGARLVVSGPWLVLAVAGGLAFEGWTRLRSGLSRR
jgi:hypothetical protein